MATTSRYIRLTLQGLILVSLYYFLEQNLSSVSANTMRTSEFCDGRITFIKFAALFVIVQDVGNAMRVDESIITLAFISKIISLAF